MKKTKRSETGLVVEYLENISQIFLRKSHVRSERNIEFLLRLIHSTAPNPDFQIGVKSAAQY